ncbi:MAG: hypothetical protein Q7V63_04460 [Gammaproteobacteria bacterium]|nr:hypothetical protein [Gammaproteobacteria bacterium]
MSYGSSVTSSIMAVSKESRKPITVWTDAPMEAHQKQAKLDAYANTARARTLSSSAVAVASVESYDEPLPFPELAKLHRQRSRSRTVTEESEFMDNSKLVISPPLPQEVEHERKALHEKIAEANAAILKLGGLEDVKDAKGNSLPRGLWADGMGTNSIAIHPLDNARAHEPHVAILKKARHDLARLDKVNATALMVKTDEIAESAIITPGSNPSVFKAQTPWAASAGAGTPNPDKLATPSFDS